MTTEKLYKLTDENNRTRHDMQWGAGVTHHANASLPAQLCTAGVIHAYRSAELAAFMAPIHVDRNVRTLWIAKGKVVVDDGTKVGCRSLTTLRRADLSTPTKAQRIAFGILAAMEVYKNPTWVVWAEGWLSCTDRSGITARAAARAAAEAAWAAWAAAEAAWAAEAAAWAAEAAWAAARAAARAAEEAAWAAGRAINKSIDLTAIAKRALAQY